MRCWVRWKIEGLDGGLGVVDKAEEMMRNGDWAEEWGSGSGGGSDLVKIVGELK